MLSSALLAAIPTGAAAQGWYLVVPPLSAPLGRRAVEVAESAPLDQWDHLHWFGTAAECEKRRANDLTKTGDELVRVGKLSPRPADWQELYLSAVVARKRAVAGLCFPVLDPRVTPPHLRDDRRESNP